MPDRPANRADRAAGVLVCFCFRLIQFAEGLFRTAHLSRTGSTSSHEAIVLRVVQADASGMLGREGLRHLAPNGNPNGRVATHASVVEVAPQPPVTLKPPRITCRLPYLRRAKV